MYTPQFRFVLLISLFVIFGTTAQVLYSYSFGEHGLNLERYLHGVLTISASTFGGFFFIWVCSKFITFNGLKTTGFEGGFADEYGTRFVFKYPIKLTKFIPEIITTPNLKNISKLESEIIGFLYSFKNTPMDINDPKSISIYDYSMAMWNTSRRLKNTSPFHSIVALSKYLGLTYVYKEKRKIYPKWQFWRKDKISYSKRCLFHTGYSSFILSTMPSFQKLDEKSKKILLVAVRFIDTPMYIPTNSDPIVYSLYETTHKIEQSVIRAINKHKPKKEIDPSDGAITQFKQQVKDFLMTSIKELDLNPNKPINQSDGVYMGLGITMIKLPSLVREISKNLKPDIRSEFDLWEFPEGQHSSWKYILEAIEDMNLYEDNLDGRNINKGINSFIIEDFAVHNSILLKIEKQTSKDLRIFLDSLPEFKSYTIIEKDEDEVIKEIKEKSKKIDSFIQNIYG